MSIWDGYAARLGVSVGQEEDPKRSTTLDHARGRTARKITASAPYETVVFNGGELRVSIADVAEDFFTKMICSMPGEDLPHGGIVEWGGSMWLITEVDPHNTIYARGLMRMCNYELKWLDETGTVISRWCVVEDGTKYLVGTKTTEMMSIGDARIAVTLGKDEDTSKLNRGKRFLIDDMDSGDVLAYEVTKPNKMFKVYKGRGVFRFILGEVNLTDDDNTELRIADYYNWRPPTGVLKPDTKTDDSLSDIVEDAVESKERTAERVQESGVWL